MAETTTSGVLTVTQWQRQFMLEYMTENLFAPYMGAGSKMNGSIIAVAEDLTKGPGDNVIVPLVTSLRGNGVQGNTPLEGNEEEIGNYGWPIPVKPNRNGVKMTEWEMQKSAIELFDAARPLLKNWAMESLRGGEFGDQTGLSAMDNDLGIIDNLLAFYDGTTYALYPNASEAVKDAWLANNSDRVLFGNAISNNSSNDHSASLSNVDATNDKLTAASVTLLKERANAARNPRITPYQAKQDKKWYVLFAQSRAFRDLNSDTVIQQANREAWARYNGGNRDDDNPIFVGGDLIYNGVIIREVPEIPVIPGVGASNIDVAPVFLCGLGAIGVAWARRPTIRTLNAGDGTDYGFRQGVAIQEMRGVRKMFYKNKQFGVVTGYFSGVAST